MDHAPHFGCHQLVTPKKERIVHETIATNLNTLELKTKDNNP